MAKGEKLRAKLLRLPGEMPFGEVKQVLEGDDWQEVRITGDHHVFTKPGKRTLPIVPENGKVKRGYLRRIAKELTEAEREE